MLLAEEKPLATQLNPYCSFRIRPASKKKKDICLSMLVNCYWIVFFHWVIYWLMSSYNYLSIIYPFIQLLGYQSIYSLSLPPFIDRPFTHLRPFSIFKVEPIRVKRERLWCNLNSSCLFRQFIGYMINTSILLIFSSPRVEYGQEGDCGLEWPQKSTS